MKARPTLIAFALAAAYPYAAQAAPKIAIVSPQNGATIKGAISQSSACEAQGTSDIRRVVFYLDGTQLNTENNAPWNCNLDTTKFSDGAHTLRAVAYDRRGDSASTQISVNIQNSAPAPAPQPTTGPTVQFTAPAEGGPLSGNVQGPPNCIVEGANIARVMFYLNDVWTNTDGNLDNGLGCWIDTTKYADGPYTVKAVAYDAAGNTATATRSITIQNTAPAPQPQPAEGPTVRFTAPAEGGPLSGNVQGPPNCIVEGSNIARVMFYLNDVWTNTDGNLSNGLGCWIDTRKYKDGPYTVKAVAYDDQGRTATATRSITIANGTTSSNTPPSVSFKTPGSGAKLSGAVSGSACEALASDSDGIKQVQFFLGSAALNTELNAPYNCAIDTTKFADGSHALKAVATDGAGTTSTAQVNVEIANGTSSASGPTVKFTAPAEGGPLSGNVQGPPNCVVEGTNIARVMFYLNDVWTNTDGNLANGLGCWIDTTKYKDGPYTVKAVAYDAAGNTATATRSITIANGTTSANTPPSVSFKAPTAGATLKGVVNSTTCEASAADADGTVSKVDFYVGSTFVNSKSAAPWQCNIDTTKFPDGDHTLMAVATDNGGASATTQRAVKIDNSVSSDPGTGGSPISSADIIDWAHQDVPFSGQGGYTAQVIGTFTSAPNIPESGIHGKVLSNGESLRMGKETDPVSSTRKALAFQVDPGDPSTSGSKRSELSMGKNIEMGKTYWVGVSVFVRDWGSLSSSDRGLFGTQMHSGDNSRGLSPSFGIYVAGSNGRNLQVQTRYSTSSSPSSGNTTTIRHSEYPIPFGQWVDFVFKFRHSTKSDGFLQAWMNGQPIANYQGPLGFNTPGYKDYAKFGYYNWSSAFNSPRKVMLRSPVVVADPTGGKYGEADVRAHLHASSQ